MLLEDRHKMQTLSNPGKEKKKEDCVLKGLILLERNDSLDKIIIRKPDFFTKSRWILPNCHISIWTYRNQRKWIYEFINGILKNTDVVLVSYPTKMIDRVFEYYKEYKYKHEI